MIDEKRPDQAAKPEQADLERLTIDAIHEHRTLIAAAEAADEALQAAKGDPGVSPERYADLEAACVKSRLTLTAQQLALSSLIDRLGYIPDVPPTGAGGSRLN